MENKKMTIGINASFLRKPETGIGQVTFNFLGKLNELKVKEMEFILYLEEDLPKGLKLSKNFKKRIFFPAYKRDDLIRKIWWEKFLLPKKVKEDRCDVFISLYQCPTSIQPYKEVKHIMVVHDIIPELFPEYLDNCRKKIYWRLTKKGIKNSDKIIAISSRTEKDLIEHLDIPADKITTSYIGSDEIYEKGVSDEEKNHVLKKYKLKPGYILAGGGYEVRKNVEGVIRAYKMLLEQNKNLHFVSRMPELVIYGKILPVHLKLALNAEKLLRELNLTEHVKLLDAVPQKDLPALFLGAIMFVYPSRYEGFGLPVLEAMGSGTPVIAGKTSSLPEVGGDAIFYCHPDDFSDIAMVMKNLLVKKHLREHLKLRGRERAKNFSWEKFTEKVLNIISNYENTN